ncbi:uncharacterized protein N7473_005134 [Penicillium subrubescens]|uniref:uncharacterized protein n=1 Tax=Penicillium subrubescens TaxID=1316194 RepID=UPI002544E875|nr:uncharacterized protein N7473_005134 [Penicillium subrubescens]KAJ5895735.1 hypothetical protein N7473_005134 [Penicillium subrubescens]
MSQANTDFLQQYDSAKVSEPIIVDVSKPDNYTSRAKESASSAHQRISEYFEPGDKKTTTRRMSDTPTSMRDQFKESTRESAEKGKSMLDSAHETVAKALGGSSRGE